MRARGASMRQELTLVEQEVAEIARLLNPGERGLGIAAYATDHVRG